MTTAGDEQQRPYGTVTFVFTDIVGSTPMWERNPTAMSAALALHDRVVRSAVRAHDGHVFSTAGDSFAAAFHSPLDALQASADAQLELASTVWPVPVELRVRIGVHVGVADERDGDYLGSAVNRAARLMSLAHGGQVLVSQAVAETVGDALPDGLGLRRLGEHALRGLTRPEHIFQLVGNGLATDFPPVGSSTRFAGNVPRPATSLVGRSEEVGEVVAELVAHRLVTLVGPGGVGKTRLSIEVAGALLRQFPDGAWFVELAPVNDRDALVHVVASVLSVVPEAGNTLLGSIAETLTSRRALLVLDNCEHVVDAAAELAATIVSASPHSRVLATSREPLGVPGERVWSVPALNPAREAIELFCERAAAADRTFAPTSADLVVIAEICRHLDGMPLGDR